MDDSAEQDAALLELLDDLDSWGGAMQHRERIEEVRDRSRSAYAEVTLSARLMASRDFPVSVEVRGVGPLQGVVEQVGRGWFRLAAGQFSWAVRTDALLLARGLADRAVPEQAWSPLARLGYAAVFRRAADAGEPCLMVLEGAQGRSTMLRDAVVLRVGADFVELRTEGEASGILVSIAAVTAVRSGV